MADTKTANDWKQVIAGLESQIATLENQQKQITDNIDQLRAQRVKLSGQIGRLPAGSAERIAANQQAASLDRQIEQLENQRNQISGQIVNLDAQVQAAERQANVATESPQGTLANPAISTNPPPVNPDPGNNTTVEPPPAIIAPVDQNFIDANAEPALSSSVSRENEAFLEANFAEPMREPPPVDDEFGDLEGAIARNQEDDEARAELQRESRRTTVAANVAEARKQQEVKGSKDMRVRLRLAPRANYLYKDPEIKKDDLLYPLLATDGVIFPYTPTINLTYSANYQPTDITHSNYKYYNYQSSSVDSVQITGVFTAQDTMEANYMLAVMHFFRCVTKMFYGKDENPIRGTPPPLLYLSGYGSYGFTENALVVTSFNLNYPDDVDYINAGTLTGGSAGFTPYTPPVKGKPNTSNGRLQISGLQPGGAPPPPKFAQNPRTEITTRVPTKLQIQLSCQPIVTRDQISNNFSLKGYGKGIDYAKGVW